VPNPGAAGSTVEARTETGHAANDSIMQQCLLDTGVKNKVAGMGIRSQLGESVGHLRLSPEAGPHQPQV
jgi:hypothetical protein